MTHLLEKLAALLSEDDILKIPQTEIRDMLRKIKKKRENTLMAMNRLELAYRQKE